MTEYKYSVFVDGICVAKSMNLDGATLFMKALLQTYYNEKAMKVSIQKDAETEEEVFF